MLSEVCKQGFITRSVLVDLFTSLCVSNVCVLSLAQLFSGFSLDLHFDLNIRVE